MDERHYVGIDVHQGKCVWCLVDATGAVIGEGSVRTDLAGLDLMTQEWRRLGTREVRVGLEASTAGKAVARHLRDGGWDVCMAHPRALKAITTSETKTDRNDARTLAHLVRLDYFPRAYLPSEDVERLRDLVRMREGQVDKFRRTKHQLRALLVGHHLNHETAKYDELFGAQALRWLKGAKLVEPIEQQRMALLLEEGALYQRQVEVLTVSRSPSTASGRRDGSTRREVPSSTSGSAHRWPDGPRSRRRCPREETSSTSSSGGRRCPGGRHDLCPRPPHLTGLGGELPEEAFRLPAELAANIARSRLAFRSRSISDPHLSLQVAEVLRGDAEPMGLRP